MQYIGPALQDILNQAYSALEGVSLAPKRYFVTSGDIAIVDDCCDGLLWVRLEGMTQRRISSASSSSRCPMWWEARVELGYMNCASSTDDMGRPPSASQITKEALRDVSELTTLEQVIISLDYLVVNSNTSLDWFPNEPLGGCSGGAWHFTIRVCG